VFWARGLWAQAAQSSGPGHSRQFGPNRFQQEHPVRKFAIGLAVLALSVASAAQIPTSGNVFFGYSYNRADFNAAGNTNLNGWNGSLEGKFLPWVGMVADLSGHYGSRELSSGISASTSLYSFLFGPRLSVSVRRFTPFAHALIGASHISENANAAGSSSSTSFAEALGGGIDYRLIHGIAWRFQGDLLQTRFFSNTQSDFRFSTGLVLRF
jgi:Outer membrane protein beta-barrel domain